MKTDNLVIHIVLGAILGVLFMGFIGVCRRLDTISADLKAFHERPVEVHVRYPEEE